MNLSAIPILILLSVSVVFGQSDFRSGYLINNQNDTLPGFINYKERNFEICIFKSEQTGESITYSPESIQAYGFENDKYFESRMDKVIDSTQRVFAEVLVKGKVSLYHYKGRFFVEKDSHEFHELKSEKTEVSIEGKRGYRESTKYIGVLKYLLQECDHLSPKIEGVKIGEKPLTKLIETYNSCVSAEYVSYKERKPWTKVSYGIVGGYDISRLNFSTMYINPPEYLTADNLKANHFAIGGFLDISSPRINERISFHPELWYVAPQYFMYFEDEGSFYVERNDVFINFSGVKIPAALRYTFPSRKLTPFLNAGVTNYFIFQEESKRILETESKSTKTITTREDVPIDLSQHQFGIYGGAGLHYALRNETTLFLETRFEKGDGLVSDKYNFTSILSSKTTTLSLIMGINF